MLSLTWVTFDNVNNVIRTVDVLLRLDSEESTSPHFSPGGEMIAQRFGFTRDFQKEQNTGCISD